MSKHIVTINKSSLQDSIKFEGCSECQTSCQSACKTRSAQNRKKQKQREHKLMHGQAPGLETGGFSCERMDEGGREIASEFSALPDRLRRTIPLKP